MKLHQGIKDECGYGSETYVNCSAQTSTGAEDKNIYINKINTLRGLKQNPDT